MVLILPIILDQGLPTFLGDGQLDGAYNYNGHCMNLLIKMQIEIIRLWLCFYICYTNWLRREYYKTVTNIQTTRKLHIRSPYEYSKILSSIQKHFLGHQGAHGHTFVNSCTRTSIVTFAWSECCVTCTVCLCWHICINRKEKAYDSPV